MSLKRQMSWKNILSRRKKTSTSDDDIEENEDGYMDGDNISIGSTTSAFPSFEAKHFSKWKNKWRSGKKGEKGDGDDLSISSTTSAFTSSKFPTPSWTTKFYANKFLKKRGQSKTRGNSECSNGEEELPPWPKSATLKHQRTQDFFSPLKKTPSLYSMGNEEPSVVIHASPRVVKVPPRRRDIPLCWEPIRKRERLSKKKDILTQIWHSKASIRKINALILEHLDLYHYSVCRLVCKDWMGIIDCYYPRRLQRKWEDYFTCAEAHLPVSVASSVSSYDNDKNPFFN